MAGQGYEGEKVVAFDQSLSSKSKLIRVPNNQFTNKLKEKAENFELQRIKNASPNKISIDHKAGGFENIRNSLSPSNQNGAPVELNYQTWKQGPESASTNGRA